MLADRRPFEIDFNSFLICDEADMVLIDNATVPFIISRSEEFKGLKYLHFSIEIFYQMVEDEHFEFLSESDIRITEKGYAFIEE